MSTLNLGNSLILDTDYSTSEVKTGATWTNGKPIYRKVVEFTYPSSVNTWGNKNHGISTSTYGNFRIVKIEGCTFDATPYFKSVLSPTNDMTITRTTINFKTSDSNLVNRNGWVIIYFTDES